jgi:hypothetical protein
MLSFPSNFLVVTNNQKSTNNQIGPIKCQRARVCRDHGIYQDPAHNVKTGVSGAYLRVLRLPHGLHQRLGYLELPQQAGLALHKSNASWSEAPHLVENIALHQLLARLALPARGVAQNGAPVIGCYLQVENLRDNCGMLVDGVFVATESWRSGEDFVSSGSASRFFQAPSQHQLSPPIHERIDLIIDKIIGLSKETGSVVLEQRG